MAKGLLTRLEQQLHRGVGLHKLGLAGLEKRAAPSRAVAYIVAAGMHATVGGSERLARFLGNGRASMSPRSMITVPASLVCARTIALSSRGRTGTDQANNTGAVDKRGMGMSISSRRAWI